MGGSEQTTPTQARVMMLGFSFPLWQLTITAGSGNNMVSGCSNFFSMVFISRKHGSKAGTSTQGAEPRKTGKV
jgi:hypothetical protein